VSDQTIFLCGGDLTPGERDECAEPLHDYPLPAGYVDAGEVAARRIAKGWGQRRCPRCGLYGWTPGRPLNDESDQAVPR